MEMFGQLRFRKLRVLYHSGLGALSSVLEKSSRYPLDRRLSGSWNWSACNGVGEVLVVGCYVQNDVSSSAFPLI
jgi:hypothetical protein